ncbi:MAG: hypothetical protein ABIK89_26065, partial [Planctomycetota bacterium]
DVAVRFDRRGSSASPTGPWIGCPAPLELVCPAGRSRRQPAGPENSKSILGSELRQVTGT